MTSVGLIDRIDGSRTQSVGLSTVLAIHHPSVVRCPVQRLIGRLVNVGWFALRKLRPTSSRAHHAWPTRCRADQQHRGVVTHQPGPTRLLVWLSKCSAFTRFLAIRMFR